MTSGYALPAKYVIHTVAPTTGNEEQLRACYSNTLKLMEKNNIRSIAIPCIGTGIFGFPCYKAAVIALQTVRQVLETSDDAKKIERIIFCVFSDTDEHIYENLLQQYFPLHQPEAHTSNNVDKVESSLLKPESKSIFFN